MVCELAGEAGMGHGARPTAGKAMSKLDASNTQARQDAKVAAYTIRKAITEPATAGERGVAHVLMAKPRRGVWVTTWSNLPGLMLHLDDRTYTHVLLPGWQYTAGEMQTEMLEDLERYALTGEQPKTVTRKR